MRFHFQAIIEICPHMIAKSGYYGDALNVLLVIHTFKAIENSNCISL